MHILCLHGPNLNLLGEREPEVYGRTTLAEINENITAEAKKLGLVVKCRQSNHEGVLVDWLQQARGQARGLIINPGAYTHTSVAIRDAVTFLDVPSIEVHISNVYQRESFRHRSLFSDVCAARLMGFGPMGYTLALQGLSTMLAAPQ